MVHILQIAVSLIFFLNKVLVFSGKKVGWLIGAIAATLAVFYFYAIELYVYTALEFGLIALMGYGFFAKDNKNPKTEKLIHWVIVLVMMILTVFVFTGMLTIHEFVSSVLLLIGTYFLTHSNVTLGWICYLFAHVIAAYIGFEKNQNFFADFQIASAIISLIGVSNTFFGDVKEFPRPNYHDF